MFLEGHFQNAYVTADLDAAMAAMRAEFGVEKFRVLSDGTGEGLQVDTPSGPQRMVVKAAVARLGNLTIEIIEPVSGAVDFYRDWIDPVRPFTFHHMGLMAPSAEAIDALRIEGETKGRPPVAWGAYPGGAYAYIDARRTLGHYLEYVYFG